MKFAVLYDRFLMSAVKTLKRFSKQLKLVSDQQLRTPVSCAQVLQDKREAPQLPASYPVMALLAMIPIAFFTVMNPRALAAMDAHDDGNKEQA